MEILMKPRCKDCGRLLESDWIFDSCFHCMALYVHHDPNSLKEVSHASSPDV